MENENRIEILSDENGLIEFDDITVVHDTVSRTDVAAVEQEIAKLENDKIVIDNRVVELKAKVLYAKKVIAIADAKRMQETITATACNDVSESATSILADAIIE